MFTDLLPQKVQQISTKVKNKLELTQHSITYIDFIYILPDSVNIQCPDRRSGSFLLDFGEQHHFITHRDSIKFANGNYRHRHAIHEINTCLA